MSFTDFDASQFQQLIKKSNDFEPKENLPLPSHLQILWNQTESLITALLSLKRRRAVCSFPKLKEIIERQTHHSFTEHSLSQILRILPDQTLKLEWFEDRRRILPHELRLDLILTTSVENVLNFARQYLIDFVKSFHSDFLRSIGVHVTEIYEWHIQFDLSSVPSISPVELIRPVITRQPTILESFHASLPKPNPISVIPPSVSVFPIPKSCRNLDSFFTVVKRVQEKEALNEQLIALAANKRTTELLAMSDHLNAFFQGKGKRCLPLSEVLFSVAQGKQFREMDQSRMIGIIEELTEKSDGYFRQLDLRGVSYLQVEPQSKRTYQMARGPIVRACMKESERPGLIHSDAILCC
jgi:glycosyltransferase involved in cell wall biosynthesis